MVTLLTQILLKDAEIDEPSRTPRKNLRSAEKTKTGETNQRKAGTNSARNPTDNWEKTFPTVQLQRQKEPDLAADRGTNRNRAGTESGSGPENADFAAEFQA